MNLRTFAVVMAVVVGILTAIQARMNGGLAAIVHNGFEAAVVSFGSGFIILCIIALLAPKVRRGIAAIPQAVKSGELKWWHTIGGFLGGTFVAIQSTTVPVLGVAVFTVAVVAGQSANSLVVDRIGLGPAGRQTISGARVTAALLAVVAVTIAVSNRFGSASFSIAAIIAAFAAGLIIAVQQAINGRVGRASANPLSAAWLNFFFGVTGLVIGLLVASAFTDMDPAALPSGPIWLYLGGAVGVVFIATAAWAVQVVGVLLFALASIMGQLIGALVLDLVLPTAGTSVGWQLFIGVVLTGIAVSVAALAPRWSRSARIGV